ncbi:MAG: hypothetical protein HRT86_14005 [Ilumatobacteraceae bacterium]|nr:hypothetical protein [Ilumatobacteraceae bacterium]
MTDDYDSGPTGDEERDALASAYVDGELDDATRTAVEADDELMLLVRSMSSTRALLADTEPAPISMRERHLAAALDAWERLPEAERSGTRRDQTPTGVDGAAAAGAAAVSAPPTSLRQRRSRNNVRWLSAAAAALVLVLAGGLIVQTVTDTDDDDQADLSADATSDTVTAGDLESRSVSESDDALAATPARGDTADGELSDDDEIELFAEDSAGSSALPEEAEEAVDESDTLVIGPDDLGPPPDTDLESLESADDVGAFAAAAVDAPRAPDIDTDTTQPTTDDARTEVETDLPDLAAEPLCGAVDVVVGRAFYAGQLAVIGIDQATDVAFAHLPETCTELVRAALP